ncbi:hypothetical protein [uncultured Roseobacter sp.]|nr:hypothetical protein [uncultured Roseobacter sp.]
MLNSLSGTATVCWPRRVFSDDTVPLARKTQTAGVPRGQAATSTAPL